METKRESSRSNLAKSMKEIIKFSCRFERTQWTDLRILMEYQISSAIYIFNIKENPPHRSFALRKGVVGLRHLIYCFIPDLFVFRLVASLGSVWWCLLLGLPIRMVIFLYIFVLKFGLPQLVFLLQEENFLQCGQHSVGYVQDLV